MDPSNFIPPRWSDLWTRAISTIPPEWLHGIKVTDIAIAIFALLQLFIYLRQTKMMKLQLDIIKQQVELATHSLVLERIPSLEILSAKLERFSVDRRPTITIWFRTEGYFKIKIIKYFAVDDYSYPGKSTVAGKSPRNSARLRRFLKKTFWCVTDMASEFLTKAIVRNAEVHSGLRRRMDMKIDSIIPTYEMINILKGETPYSINIYIIYSINKVKIHKNFRGEFSHETGYFNISMEDGPMIVGDVSLPGSKDR